MLANAQSQRITSLPVDSGASRGNQLSCIKNTFYARFYHSPRREIKRRHSPTLTKNKDVRRVDANFPPPAGRSHVRAGARFSSHTSIPHPETPIPEEKNCPKQGPPLTRCIMAVPSYRGPTF